MFNEYFLEFDVNLKRANHLFETAYDRLDVLALELYTLESASMMGMDEDPDAIFHEGVGSFVDAVKAFFAKIRDGIKKLYANIKDKIDNIIRKHELKKRIKAAKTQIAMQKGSASGKNEKSELINTAALYKAYTSYMNEYVKEVRKLYGKTYDSIDEYREAVAKSNKVIEAKFVSLGLDDVDAQIIKTDVISGLTFTDKEADNMGKIAQMMSKQLSEVTTELEKIAVTEDDASKISDVKSQTSKLNSQISSGLNKIVNGWSKNYKTILAVSAAVLAASGGTYLAMKKMGSKNGSTSNVADAASAVANAVNTAGDTQDTVAQAVADVVSGAAE